MRPQAIIGLCVFVFCLIVAVGLPSGGWGKYESWRVVSLAASAVGLIVLLSEPQFGSSVWRRRKALLLIVLGLIAVGTLGIVIARSRAKSPTAQRVEQPIDRPRDQIDEAIDEVFRMKAATDPKR
jgi:type VI protein secretion system component VasK